MENFDILQELSIKKYLLGINGTFYALDETELIEVNEIQPPLTKADFEQYGFISLDSLLDVNTSDMALLISPFDDDVVTKIEVGIAPESQLILPSGDIVLRGVHQVNNFELTVIPEDTEDIKIICSVDSGENWLTYSTEASQFQPIEVDDLDEIETNGMTTNTFNSIGSKWNDIIEDGKIRFAYYLGSDNIGILSGIDKLTVDVEAFHRWRKSHRGRDYEYEFFNEKLLVTLKEDGSYKINYMV